MTYKDQFTTLPISYMVLDVVDEIYNAYSAYGNLIVLSKAVEIEEIAASEVERVINGIIAK